MIDDPAKVGATLRTTRESLGFGLREWAELVNVSKPYLSLIERGQRSAPAYVIEAYERVSRKVLMKRRTIVAALAAVPALAAAEEVRDPLIAERTLQYGLWLGNQGNLAEASRMYGVATTLADWVGDAPTRGYVRARIASRVVYEGCHKATAMQTVAEALSISKSSRTVVESHAALVEVHTLSRDYRSARAAGQEMLRAAATEEDHVRTAVFVNYLECMIGDPKAALKTYERYEAELAANRVWAHEAAVYRGMALVRAGDRQGVSVALAAMKGLGIDVRMVGMAVDHLLKEVDFDTDDVRELRGFARV